jgi:hypothetical protein
MKTTRNYLLILALFLAATPAVYASITASEDFQSYAPGTLSSQAGGGIGWTGPWGTTTGNANVLDTTASPLTYSIVGGGKLNGGSRAMQGSVNTVASGTVLGNRQLASPLTSTFFVSCMMQYSGTGTNAVDGNDTFSFYLSNGAGATANALTFGFRNPAAGQSPTFMVRTATGSPPAGGFITPSNGVPAGQAYLAVAQYLWDGTSYSGINAWLNPAYGDSGTPQITQSLTAGSGLTSASYAFFRDFANSTGDAWTVDNLLVGSTWADVVAIPEPNSAVLLTLGAAVGGLFSLRRGKR